MHRLLRAVFATVVLSATTLAYPQAASQSAAPSSEARKSFETLKSLAGTWTVMMDGKPLPGTVTIRVTSKGNALLHEIRITGSPDDPITMFNLDGDHLVLTHYCDAGNQPHMVGTVSPDGKTISFDFVSATNLNSSQEGHMQRAVFHIIDANHHTEEWNFAMAHGKPMDATLDLKRTE